MTYLLVLASCLLGTLPLELFLRVGVYRQWRRLLLTLAPVLAVFVTWDVLAVHAHHWRFDPEQVLPPRLLGLPLEELAFFVVIPLCSVLGFEAVRRKRP